MFTMLTSPCIQAPIPPRQHSLTPLPTTSLFDFCNLLSRRAAPPAMAHTLRHMLNTHISVRLLALSLPLPQHHLLLPRLIHMYPPRIMAHRPYHIHILAHTRPHHIHIMARAHLPHSKFNFLVRTHLHRTHPHHTQYTPSHRLPPPFLFPRLLLLLLTSTRFLRPSPPQSPHLPLLTSSGLLQTSSPLLASTRFLRPSPPHCLHLPPLTSSSGKTYFANLR